MRRYEDVAEEVVAELSRINFREFRVQGERLARNLPSSGPIYLVYDFENAVPASSMYWTISTLKPGFNVKLVEIQSFLSLLAPYTYNSHVVILVDSSRYAVQLRDNVNILGNVAHIITSNPSLADKIRGEKVIVGREHSEFTSLTCKTVTLIAAGLTLVREECERRSSKMLEEISTLNEVVDDMLTYYRGQIEDVVDEPDYVVASEPLRFQAERAYQPGSNIILWSQIDTIPPRSTIHVWKTSLEDYAVRELVRKCISSSIKMKVVDFKTDPISAQIYSLIVSEVTRRLKML